MISHLAVQRALRTHLLTLSVCTTGPVALSVDSATVITRATGSFLTDGFAVGMEASFAAFGFAENNARKRTITELSATRLAFEGPALVPETAATATISVVLPNTVAWEGTELEPTAPVPYVVERYLAGPTALVTLSQDGELECTPQYQLVCFAASGAGMEALSAYADALLAHFRPRTALNVADGTVVVVRGDTGPFRSQLALDTPGWSALSVTIPLRAYVPNS